MVKLIFLFINIIMFSFTNQASAKYEKVFFDFKIEGISGDLIDLNEFKGRAILVVNTASYCGFTKQYNDLQNLWDKYKKDGLVVLGIPSNSFNQEKNSNQDVKDFCELNFNIDFPLTQITKVKGDDAHPLFLWAKNNYGKSAIPKWNFHKILINKDGKIVDTYSSLTNPMSNKIQNKIQSILKN